ncbi:MAG: GNAT family N-acetyltransferase [Candidatus Nanopelagicales bacterium]
MPLHPPRPAVHPARHEDLVGLQELARRTIDASYRSFLGDEGVDRFLSSGASDAHIEIQFRQGHVHCLRVEGQLGGLVILDGPTIDLLMIDVRRHRQGLGTALLSRAEEMLFVRYEELRLESFADNRAANAFYGARGWLVAGRLNSEGPAKIEMIKRRPDASAA